MKITLKEFIKMSDNKDDKGQVAKPVLRHLRRSKTINVARYGGNEGPTTKEGSLDDTDKEKRTPSPVPQPTSSCQALKHAVSALTRIDDFILEELGDGFFANVYKATHKVTNEEMVMKVNKDSANRSSALREVQLMNKLSHPNILRFLGVCVHEGQLHALTEYISGGTLEDLLANKDEELPWTLRIKLSLDIAKGMHYLHSERVFHRDLTSKNVLIKKGENRNYQAVIADFGLATKIPDPNSTEPLPSVGCPWWMAPEVIHGKFYDQRADLFSYGIILLEITARIEADPETMPRTKKFGVDYIKICEMVEYCPLDFLQLAFKCCQILPELRPSSSAIISSLEKIYKNLRTNAQNNSGKLHKRSRSEDNIIQSSESMTGDEMLMTPQIIAQAMTKDDPHYCPANANPFASISKFKDGRKVLEFPKQRKCSMNNGLALLYGKQGDQMSSSFQGGHIFMKPESQSLPCSPVMLRRAAEKLHQASLHGSDTVEPGEELEIRFSLSSDHQDIGNTSPASEKRARFGCSRTRSLGSLDYFSPLGLSIAGRIRQKQYQMSLVDKKGYCNRETARIRESSVEDQLLNGLGESTDDLNENSVYSDCLGHVRSSLTSDSFISLSSGHDETSGYARYGSCDNGEPCRTSIYGSHEGSVSCCSLSSYISCGEIDPDQLDSCDSVVFKHQDGQVVEAGDGQEVDESKPCIALECQSYEADHFGKETVKGCLENVDPKDLIITKL